MMTHPLTNDAAANVTRIVKPAESRPAGETIPKLYRVSAVMAQLGVSRATIYRMVAAGKLRLVKIGERSSGITAESIDALLNADRPK